MNNSIDRIGLKIGRGRCGIGQIDVLAALTPRRMRACVRARAVRGACGRGGAEVIDRAGPAL